MALEWCEARLQPNPVAILNFTSSVQDMGELMRFADFLGMDDLLNACATSVNKLIRNQPSYMRQKDSTIYSTVMAMDQPLQLKLLDHSDAATFPVLRRLIAPTNTHYVQQLCNLLQENQFARSQNGETAYSAYEVIMKVQQKVISQMNEGRLHKRTQSTISHAEFSPDCRYLCIVGYAGDGYLTLWDLLHSSMKSSWCQKDVLKATFGPDNCLVTLHLCGQIKIWSITNKVSPQSTLEIDGAHDMFASERYLLAIGGYGEVRMWEWKPSMVLVNTQLFDSIVQCCFSASGEFAVATIGRGVRCVTTPWGHPGEMKVMQCDETQPMSRLLVSGDNKIIAAVFSSCVRLWRADNVESAAKELKVYEGLLGSGTRQLRILDAAFSPDSSQIIIGCASGDLILLTRTGDSFHEFLRFKEDFMIKHLSWSPDGRFIAFSSFQGITMIDLAKEAARSQELFCPIQGDYHNNTGSAQQDGPVSPEQDERLSSEQDGPLLPKPDGPVSSRTRLRLRKLAIEELFYVT